MNLETVNITFTSEDLRTLETIIKRGVTQSVTRHFNEGDKLQTYIDDNLDDLEMLSDLCSIRNGECNLNEYATKIYNELKDE